MNRPKNSAPARTALESPLWVVRYSGASVRMAVPQIDTSSHVHR